MCWKVRIPQPRQAAAQWCFCVKPDFWPTLTIQFPIQCLILVRKHLYLTGTESVDFGSFTDSVVVVVCLGPHDNRRYNNADPSRHQNWVQQWFCCNQSLCLFYISQTSALKTSLKKQLGVIACSWYWVVAVCHFAFWIIPRGQSLGGANSVPNLMDLRGKAAWMKRLEFYEVTYGQESLAGSESQIIC